jgi:hypothetical protein
MTIGTYIRWHPDTYARLALAATRSRQSIGDYCRTVISRSLRF